MIRWNKWTEEYTYTYEWHDGAWRLIHKKSNRPIASWFGKMYSMFSQITRVQFETLEHQIILDEAR